MIRILFISFALLLSQSLYAHPLRFSILQISHTNAEKYISDTSFANDLSAHPFDGSHGGRAWDKFCKENIEDILQDEVRSCGRSGGACDKLYFVILPCPAEYNTADPERWEEFRKVLDDHYSVMSGWSWVSDTPVKFRFRVFEWATQIWQQRYSSRLARDRMQKISQIKIVVSQKLNVEPKLQALNHEIYQISLVKGLIEDYGQRVEPLKVRIQSYLAHMHGFKNGYGLRLRTLQELVGGVATCAKEKSKLAGLLAQQKKIEELDLENRTQALQLAIKAEDLLHELRSLVWSFMSQMEPYKDFSKSWIDLKTWEAPLFEALQSAKLYSETRISKFHDRSISAIADLHHQFDVRAAKMASLEFSEATRKARDLESSAKFLGLIRKKTEFLRKEPSLHSKSFIPFMSQVYQDHIEFLGFVKICEPQGLAVKTWMKTGCLHANSSKKMVEERIRNLREELSGYLLILQSQYEALKDSSFLKSIEMLLAEAKIDAAVEAFDAMLLSLEDNL